MSQDRRTFETPPIIIDVEASGFGRGSYPIEVGVAMSNGDSQCYLIKPLPNWNHWDNDAQNVHGISRETLQRNGHDPKEVAENLNLLLYGKTVYSDAWSYDNTWVSLLFYEVGLTPRFKIESLRLLLDQAIVEHWETCKCEVIEELALTRHRASADARIIQHTLLRAAALAYA